MAFRNLFAKEWKSVLPPFAAFAAVVVLLHLFILYKGLSWDEEAVLVVSLFLPWLLASAAAIGIGYYQLHSEWKSNSIYLLLSLPIRGWKVLAAKLAAVMALLFLTLLLIGGSFGLVLARAMWSEFRAELGADAQPLAPFLLNVGFHTFWMYALTIAFLTVAVQFSFLCGQLAAKFKRLVAFVAFLGILWLTLRLSPLLSGGLLWLPDIFYGGRELEVVYLHSGPFLVLLLLTAGLLWLNGYLFEKEVEV